MVEGDLVDLALPRLMEALASEGSTAVLRVQRGSDQGALYFCEGALVHALTGAIVGDDAVLQLLGWSDGRFRLVRDGDRQPRTITHNVHEFLSAAQRGGASSGPHPAGIGDGTADERLLVDLLTLLTRLEQDRVRLVDKRVDGGAVGALLVVTAVVNSMVAFVTARCADQNVQPSRVLPRLSEQNPYTQLLGEESDRISIATAAGVLKNWESNAEDRMRLFLDLCRALVDVLATYGSTASTFFHGSREREEWRAAFDVFVDGLWTAVQQTEA